MGCAKGKRPGENYTPDAELELVAVPLYAELVVRPGLVGDAGAD